MWSREQLKDKAKYALKMNYWKIVLVTFLTTIIVAGSVGASASSGLNLDLSGLTDTTATEELMYDDFFEEDYGYDFEEDYGYSDQYYYDENSDEYLEGYWDGLLSLEQADDMSDDYYDGYNDGCLDASDEMYPSEEETDMDFSSMMSGLAVFGAIFVVVFIIVFVIVLAVSYVYAAFVGNPFQVGANRFFLKSLKEKAQVGEVGFAYDNNFKNVAKIMFFRTLYTSLWSLLFVIPGIVKGYEYQMIPYLLAENPNLTKEQAFKISKQMMDGNKWKAFVLDLSFFGWDLLSGFTCGMLGLFYVNPYKNLTYAALYEELSLIHGRPGVAQPASDMAYENTNPYGQPEYEQPISENSQEQVEQ